MSDTGRRGGPRPDPAKQLEIAERRHRVATMITAGIPYRQIAEQVGVSIATIHTDKEAILREWQEDYIERIDHQMLIDLRRLEAQITRLTLALQEEPDPRNEMVLIKCLERRARILGYDAKDRRDVPVKFPEIEPVIDTHGEAIDSDGDPITDKSPAAGIFALLGGKRQSGGSGKHDEKADQDAMALEARQLGR